MSAWVSSMEPSWPFDRPGPGVEAIPPSPPCSTVRPHRRERAAYGFAQAVATWAGTIAGVQAPPHTTGTADATGWNMLLIASASVVANKPQDRTSCGATRRTRTQSMLYLLFDAPARWTRGRAPAAVRRECVRRHTELKTYVYVAEIARHMAWISTTGSGTDGAALSLTAYAPYSRARSASRVGFPLGRDADAWVYEIAHNLA